jgi:hypothetical protein
MILRALVFVAVAAGLAALPSDVSAAPVVPASPGHSPKLLVYIAKGAPNACGRGCDHWIAVEGAVDTEAAARVRKFLRSVKDTGLPFYFNSPGGEVRQAFAIGRMLRARKAIGRVGQTLVSGCTGAQSDDACLKIKAGGGEIEARIVTRNAMCNSSCGYLFLGAVIREVPLDSAIAVHDSKLFTEFHGRPTAAQRQQVVSRFMSQADRDRSAFVREMGVDHELVDLIKTVKFESRHVLTRPELYRFRVDTRPVIETGWSVETAQRAVIRKFAMMKQGDGSSFRAMEWRLYCEGRDRTRFMFLREFQADAAVTSTVAMTAGSEKPPAFGRYPARLGVFEAWTAVMTATEVKALFAVPHLQIGESASVVEGPPSQSMFEIETNGLEAAWTQLAVTCVPGSDVAARPAASTASGPIPHLVPPSERFAAPSPGWGAFVPK